MSTSVEHAHEHEHGLAPHTKATRARAGVLMLILSDALAVLATFAAGGYLKVLNTEGAYTIAGDFAPVFWLGLVVSIGLVVSGLLSICGSAACARLAPVARHGPLWCPGS